MQVADELQDPHAETAPNIQAIGAGTVTANCLVGLGPPAFLIYILIALIPSSNPKVLVVTVVADV